MDGAALEWEGSVNDRGVLEQAREECYVAAWEGHDSLSACNVGICAHPQLCGDEGSVGDVGIVALQNMVAA